MNNEQQENKPERTDELDVIGGAVVNLVKNVFQSIKNIFVPRKVE